MTGEELEAALALHRRLERLTDELARLEADGGAPGEPGGSLFQAQMAAELTREIGGLREELSRERARIAAALEAAPWEGVSRRLMVLRYVECRPWRAIGALTGYAQSHLYRLHRAARGMIAHESS